MKKVLFLICLIAISISVAHADDYLDTIARKVCFEAKQFNVDDNYEIKLGSSMIQNCMPYRDRILTDYGIDMSKVMANDENSAQALGQIVGLRMGSVCPDVIQDVMAKGGEDTDADDVASISGKITSINTDGTFPTLVVETESKERFVFMILEDFEGAADFLKNKDSFKKKTCKFDYVVYELFDVEKLASRQYKILRGISK